MEFYYFIPACEEGIKVITGRMSHMKLERLWEGLVLLFIPVLGILVISSGSWAGVVEGKVTSAEGNMVELNIGSGKGIKSGDSGRVYYRITVGGKEKQIFIAKFKITHISEKSSVAKIEEKTGEIKVGYLAEVAIAEVAVTGGELEVKSEPSGAKVYVDEKEVGESPVLLSGISSGRRLIRVIKEGYEPYEVLEIVGVERKAVHVNLKKVIREGDLVIRTEPSGASISINGRSFGRSPYEGKGLSPGIYRVRVTKEGYETWEKAEIVEAGKRVEVFAQLRAKEGDLEVRSEPSGGKVYLDGKYMGETPLHLSHMRPGQYLVLVVKDGCYPYEERVEIGGADRKTVVASLKSRLGELGVILKTTGASLYIDGKSVEVGPRNYVGKEFSPGSYKIRVTKEGYENWEGDVVVKDGERVEVSVELKMKKGDLLVRTEPSEASIYVGGKSVGTGFYEGKDLSPGSYKMRVTKEGYEAWEGDGVVEAGKKAEILPKLKEIDWSQRSCEAPVWNLGDSWTYRDAAGKFWSHQVFEIKENLFIMRMEGDRDLYAFDKKTLSCHYLIDRSGRRVRHSDPLKNIFDFPLFIGKKWSYSTESGGANYANQFKAEAVEEVRTPAGTFKAYKIYHKQTEMSRMTSGWVRYWYSPAVRWWIKREVEPSAYWARAYGLQNAELHYYRSK